MKGALVTVVAVLGLFFCLTAALWVRSFWVGDQVRWRTATNTWFVTSDHGGVLVLAARGDALSNLQDHAAHVAWPTFGALPIGGLSMQPVVLGFETGSGAMGASMSYRAVLAPWWALAASSGAACVVFLRQWLRSRRHDQRRTCGLCVQCGYDLRGSTERCPECGAAFLSGSSRLALDC